MPRFGSLASSLAISALLFAGITPAAQAQAPPYQLQWGSLGSGPGQFNQAWGIAVDPTSRCVYVADRGNHRIQKFSASGAFLAEWGAAGSGPGLFVGPDAVAVDGSGNVYVADHDANSVQKFDANGAYLGGWITIVRSIAAQGSLVYTTDDFAGSVRVFDTNGNLLQSLPAHAAGDNGPAAPWGIALGQGGVFIADYGSSRIKFLQNGNVTNRTGALSGWDLQWLACDPGGYVYTVVSFNGGGHITVFGDSGIDAFGWGSNGSGPGQFNRPRGIAVDPDFNVYVVDSGNNRVQRFGFAPVVTHTTTWGALKQRFR